jgi:hypothetical protein
MDSPKDACAAARSFAPRNERAPPTAPFPIWKMHDGRVFTDHLHRSAYDDARIPLGSFERKRFLEERSDEIRQRMYSVAAQNAQLGRCQAPPVPPPASVQSCGVNGGCSITASDAPPGRGLGIVRSRNK